MRKHSNSPLTRIDLRVTEYQVGTSTTQLGLHQTKRHRQTGRKTERKEALFNIDD